MNRFLFLDIDGVLAGDKDWGKRLLDGSCSFDKGAVRALTRVFEEVLDLQLVISSTWREGETIESLQNIFRYRGGYD